MAFIVWHLLTKQTFSEVLRRLASLPTIDLIIVSLIVFGLVFGIFHTLAYNQIDIVQFQCVCSGIEKQLLNGNSLRLGSETSKFVPLDKVSRFARLSTRLFLPSLAAVGQTHRKSRHILEVVLWASFFEGLVLTGIVRVFSLKRIQDAATHQSRERKSLKKTFVSLLIFVVSFAAVMSLYISLLKSHHIAGC
jgi:hypothetical protein